MSENYEIGSGLTEQEIKISSWWVRHNGALRRVGYGVLIGISILLWGYTLWIMLDTYAISYPRESRITTKIDRNAPDPALIKTAKPQDIAMTEPAIFDTTDNRKDILIEIMNYNTQWWATFDYSFISGGSETIAKQSFILPASKRFITELGTRIDGDVKLQMKNIKWHRVNPSDIGKSYEEFYKDRYRITVINAKYENNISIDGKTVGQSTFELVNSSPYGFWNADIIIALIGKTGKPVSVTSIQEEQIKPGENRKIDIAWFDNRVGITQTLVQPNINILDKENYLPSSKF